jgi:hypothetical protein
VLTNQHAGIEYSFTIGWYTNIGMVTLEKRVPVPEWRTSLPTTWGKKGLFLSISVSCTSVTMRQVQDDLES